MMDLHDFRAELVAVTLGVLGAIGAGVKMLLSDRKNVEERIDNLEKTSATVVDFNEIKDKVNEMEREMVTKAEFDQFAKDIHAHNGKLRDLIDTKFESINHNLFELLKDRHRED